MIEFLIVYVHPQFFHPKIQFKFKHKPEMIIVETLMVESIPVYYVSSNLRAIDFHPTFRIHWEMLF